MVSSVCRRARCASAGRVWSLLAVVGALSLASCGPDGQPGVSASQSRGATVTFETIDGPPAEQFAKLVENLDQEAKTRRLAVVSRGQPSAYRVRGYLAVKVAKQHTTVSWLWDVFDQNEGRALRISGEEIAKDRQHRGWNAADDDMLKRIASSSMDQLATFLTSPEAIPNAVVAQAPPQLAVFGQRDGSPEAAGIFRIFKPSPPSPADEYPVETRQDPGATEEAPLPHRRPPKSAALSPEKPVAVAASSKETPAR